MLPQTAKTLEQTHLKEEIRIIDKYMKCPTLFVGKCKLRPQ